MKALAAGRRHAAARRSDVVAATPASTQIVRIRRVKGQPQAVSPIMKNSAARSVPVQPARGAQRDVAFLTLATRADEFQIARVFPRSPSADRVRIVVQLWLRAEIAFALGNHFDARAVEAAFTEVPKRTASETAMMRRCEGMLPGGDGPLGTKGRLRRALAIRLWWRHARDDRTISGAAAQARQAATSAAGRNGPEIEVVDPNQFGEPLPDP